ncbi:hypothetical protein FisN_8Lh131 [Fistulifera solaris]|uniref:HMG box domain-containing protein n=1 Tax=Fistulifera solaris TaxID=1519565 RepID=A0A1Z5JE41_FISSO|nr:hypothetical protein FisN_8Lh131 [Fistulifera solaris]|eukprot:GAX12031.1 hypothetical protein FisN_8Lh131 [Fistulifera solaris]
MSDAIASKWKALKDRSKYEEIAREDNKRYRKAMEEYNENIIRSTRIGRAALDGALPNRLDDTVSPNTTQVSSQQVFDASHDLQSLVRPVGLPGLPNPPPVPLANIGMVSNDITLQQLQNEALLRQLHEQQSNSIMLMNLRQQQNTINQLQLDQQLRYQQNQMQLQALASRLQGQQPIDPISQQLSTQDLLLSLLRKN